MVKNIEYNGVASTLSFTSQKKLFFERKIQYSQAQGSTICQMKNGINREEERRTVYAGFLFDK